MLSRIISICNIIALSVFDGHSGIMLNLVEFIVTIKTISLNQIAL